MSGIPITGKFKRGESGVASFAINESGSLIIPLQIVADITARDAFPEYLRQAYMLVYVISENKSYRLGSNITIAGQVWTLDSQSYIPLTQKGAVDGVAPLDGTGKIPIEYLQTLYLSDTYVVVDIDAMLALTTYRGNLVVVQDASDDPGVDSGSATYAKINDTPPTTSLSDFLMLEFGAVVASINGLTGAVSLDFSTLLTWGSSQTQFNAAVSGNTTVLANASAISTNAADIIILDSVKAEITNVLTLNNLAVYTPTANYHPATKKYVDASIISGVGIPEAPEDGTPYARQDATWVEVSEGGGGTPGGADTSIQYNNDSAFGGFGTWDGTTMKIPTTVGGGIEIISDSDESSLTFTNAATGNNINWKFGNDVSDQLRGLTLYRGASAGATPTIITAKFHNNGGSFIVGENFNTPHLVYWQPKMALSIGQTQGGDYAIQNYDLLQGLNVKNQGTGVHNLGKGQNYTLKGVSTGNLINIDGPDGSNIDNMTNLKFNLILEGTGSEFRDIAGSILIGEDNRYNEDGTTLPLNNLYNIQMGNHNDATDTHHLVQFGTGLRSFYGLVTWGDWTYQPKFIYGNANVQYTLAANKASFVIANGYLNNGNHTDPSTYHSNSFIHFNTGWTQINTTNAGFISGGTELSEANVTPLAAFEVVSTDSGILFPRLTSTEFGAIPGGNLVDGLVLYESTNNKLKLRANGSWVDLN
jgi:hypothetical protein